MNKQALILIHGFTEDCEISFSSLLESVKFKKFDIIKYTISGHGNSTKCFDCDDELENIKQFTEDIISKYNQVCIIGFSLGGVLASYVASIYDIDKLVLIAPAFKYLKSVDISKNILSAAKEIASAKNFDEGVDILVEKHYPDDTVFKDAKYIDKEFFAQFRTFTKLVEKAKNEIKEIKCPTLIIHGNCDEIIPVSSSLYALNLITNNNKLLIVAPDTLHRVLKSKDANKYYLMIQEFICKDRIRWYSK